MKSSYTLLGCWTCPALVGIQEPCVTPKRLNELGVCMRTIFVISCLLLLQLVACSKVNTPEFSASPQVQPTGIPGSPASPDSGSPDVSPQFPLDLSPVAARNSITSNTGPGTYQVLGKSSHSESLTGTTIHDAALAIDSSIDGLAYGIWRIQMKDSQPGLIRLDVNLHQNNAGLPSQFMVGIADYSSGRWNLQGPFTDGHLLLTTAADVLAGSDYLSPGNAMFVSVICSDDNRLDMLAVCAAELIAVDQSPPTAISGVSATAIAGGMYLEWSPNLNPDLAGYRLLYSEVSFEDAEDPNVQIMPSLAGTTSYIVRHSSPELYVRVQAVDRTGNLGPLSEQVMVQPLPDEPTQLLLNVDAPSGKSGTVFTLQTGGAAEILLDLDYDGFFDDGSWDGNPISIDSFGRTGILRFRALGENPGNAVSIAEVSVFVDGNASPVVGLTASVYAGDAPLLVDFTADAHDNEDPLEELTFKWDLDGDHVYELETESPEVISELYEFPGVYYVSCRVFDTDGAYGYDDLPIHVYGEGLEDQMPVAVLYTNPTNFGIAPCEANFNGSSSSDPNGTIELYEYDFEGDGIYDVPTTEYDLVFHIYQDPGTYYPKLRVTDNDGWQAVEQRPLEIADLEGWSTYKVYDGEQYEFDAIRLGISGSSPVFCNIWEDAPFVRFINSLDPGGSSWSDPVVVSTVSQAAGVSVMAVNGLPAFSFELDGFLNFVRAADNAGSTWLTPVQAAPIIGASHASMAIVDGNPAIAFQYGYDINCELHYVRAADASGDSWNDVVVVESEIRPGGAPHLAVVAGNPAICHHEFTSSDLLYVRALDSEGTTWGNSIVVASAGDVGLQSSMEIVNGKPAISFYKAYFDLMYVRAQDEFGASWGSPVLLSEDYTKSREPMKLMLVDGRPAVSYPDRMLGVMQFLQAEDMNGASWNEPLPVSNSMGSQMVVLSDGRPAFYEYFDNDILLTVRD